MRGRIIKRGKPGKERYTIVLSMGLDPATGKRKQQWIAVKGNKRDAERKLVELLGQLENGTYVKPNKLTIGAFLERWLMDYAKPNLSPRTVEGYEHMVHKHIIPSLGHIVLTALRPDHLQHYNSEKLASGLSARTVRHHHITLHTALQTAVKWGLLMRNVADAVDPPRFQRCEMNTLTEDELQCFLEAAKETKYYPLFYLALFTGMRRSELLALRWSDIDLLGCQVSVTKSIHYLRNGENIFRQPKTAKSRRLVALSPSTVKILREHRIAQENLRTIIDNDLVFSRVDGKPWLPDTITHAWLKIARRIGLNGIRLHDARHTHASLMLKQGVHPKIVQERLGHALIQITIDTYSHVAPSLQRAAAAKFDDIMLPPMQEAISSRILG